MGKITFRADDNLVAELEAFDASKSEVMREALRAYLESNPNPARQTPRSLPRESEHDRSVDSLIRERVDTMLERRLEERPRREARDVNVTVSLEGVEQATTAHSADAEGRSTPSDTRQQAASSDYERPTPSREPSETACGQCGERVADDHVYCPNCGEKASRRLFCECGDEVRSDWAFCPSCGRRTPAADVLESDRT